MAFDDNLSALARNLVTAYLDGHAPSSDLVSEPAAVRSGTAIVYIRLLDADPPLLRVFSPLLRGVTATPELFQTLNELNARLNYLRLFWRDGAVVAASELPAAALTAQTLAHAVDTIADAADYYDEQLQPRFGGDKAYTDQAW